MYTYLEVHGAALVTHPVCTFNALLPGSASTVTSLTLLVRVQRLVVEEFLKSDQEDVALHGTDPTRWNDALSLAERAEERLARSDLRLRQARLEAFEAEAVKARQEFGSAELVTADWTVKQVVHCRRRFSGCLTLTMVSRSRHLVSQAGITLALARWRTCYCR